MGDGDVMETCNKAWETQNFMSKTNATLPFAIL